MNRTIHPVKRFPAFLKRQTKAGFQGVTQGIKRARDLLASIKVEGHVLHRGSELVEKHLPVIGQVAQARLSMSERGTECGCHGHTSPQGVSGRRVVA